MQVTILYAEDAADSPGKAGVEMQVRREVAHVRCLLLQQRARHLTSQRVVQDLNEDADVQRLKQRRQNLMYQVAVLQLQRVSEGSGARAVTAPNVLYRDKTMQEKMAAMLRGDALAVRPQRQ